MSKKDVKETTDKNPPGAQTEGMGGAPIPSTGELADVKRGEGTVGAGEKEKTKLEPERTLADYEAMRKKERAEFEAQVRHKNRVNLASNINLAILQNPAIEKYCYGSPLEPHACGGAPNVGAYLARETLRLADDYLAELDRLVNPPKPRPLTVAEADMQATEAEAGHPTDDFPLD